MKTLGENDWEWLNSQMFTQRKDGIYYLDSWDDLPPWVGKPSQVESCQGESCLVVGLKREGYPWIDPSPFPGSDERSEEDGDGRVWGMALTSG